MKTKKAMIAVSDSLHIVVIFAFLNLKSVIPSLLLRTILGLVQAPPLYGDDIITESTYFFF